MLSLEKPRQRLFTCLDDDAFPHPLPKLCLCRPEPLPIPANHEGCFLLAFLFLVCVRVVWDHLNTPLSLHVRSKSTIEKHTQYPEGKPLLRGGSKLSKRQTNAHFGSLVIPADSTAI